MNNQNGKVICLVGPTASGKTKLAVKLAKIFNGEIVSADSRQIYKGMDIGTGKDLAEYDDISYHLIDVADPAEQFSLAQYQKLAYRAIDDIIKRGKIPFLVGGSGLYIQAVIDGYQLADIEPDWEARILLSKKTIKQLQTLIKKHGIKLNESDFQNKRRLIRAIEIVKSNNQIIKKSNNRIINKSCNYLFKKANPKYDCLILGIKYPKKIIDERIDKRLVHRLEKEGMVEEVKRLQKNGVTWKRLDDFGLEYRYMARYLKSELAYDEMIKQLSIASHQFAKRQMTWFKRDKRIKWLKNYKETEKLVKLYLK